VRRGSNRLARLLAVVAFGLVAMVAAMQPASALQISPAGANDLLVTWTASTGNDVAGYLLSYGTSSGSHPTVIDVGPVTSYDVTGLSSGSIYYFVLQAYDYAGNVGSISAEASGVPGGALPVLTLAVGDAPDPVAAGGNVTYTITGANTGTGSATGVVLTDTLPANTTFVSATGGGTLSGSVVTWNPGTLAAGASSTLQLVVRVASPLANGTIITNGACSIDSTQTTALTAAATTTTVTSSPTLTLAATDAPDPVNAGANITYTLAYGNTGNMNASGVVITDSVPVNTTFVSATGGVTQSGGVVTWSIGALNAGASGSVQMVVKVVSPLANGTVITNGTASIDSAQTTPVGAAAATTSVASSPVLTIAAADAPDPVAAGGNLTYAITYGNTGNMAASSVAITDGVPANTTFVSATGGGVEASGLVTWNVGALAAGASAAVQMVVRVASPLANGTVITDGTWVIDSSETSPVSGSAVTTTVYSAPSLAVVAADSPDPVAAGANLTWTLSYSNIGNADATGVVVSDTLPANTSFVSATGGGTLAAGVVTWNLGTLAAGGNGSVQLVAKVASPLANGTTITDATYSIRSAQTLAAAGPAVTTTVTSAPVLTVGQSDTPDPVTAGGNLTYTLSYGNTGNANGTGAVLTDVVPANTTYVSSTPAGTLSAGTVTWNLGTLAAGSSSSVQLIVKVNSPLANGTLITNPGPSLDTSETAPATAAPITTTVGSAPSLGLTMTDSPDPVAAGANLTYTIGYSNNGNANASGVQITAALPASTTFVSATGGGVAGIGSVTWAIGALNAGSSGSVQMVVRVASPLANGSTIGSGALTVACNQIATVTGPTIITTVTSAPVLTISAVDAPDPVNAGANLTYTLSYTNGGNAVATAVVLSDTLPANTTFVSATGGGVASGNVVTWNLGTLGVGASGSAQMVVRVASPLANGTTISHATYSIDSAQTTPASGAQVTTTVSSSPNLAIALAEAPDPVVAAGNLTYTLSYSNTGNANATGTIVTDALPTNTSFVSATGGGTSSAGTMTWSVGNLNAGSSGSVQLVVRVASPLADGTVITNGTGSIRSTQTAAVSATAVTTTVTSHPILTLTQADAPDPVSAGANLTYTLSYGNAGSAAATAVVMTASIPVNTTFVSAGGGGTLSGGTVTWNLGTLAAGATGSATLVVKVTSPLASGTTINSGAPVIDCAETAPVSAATITTTVSSAPALAVSMTDAPDPVAAGASITYTIAYANSGNAQATGVVLSDPIPANTTFMSATNGGTRAGSTVSWNLGTLAAGGSGSVQVVVQVASPLANGTTITNSGGNIDSTETAAVTAASITTTVASSPVLTVLASDSPDPVAAGGNLTYVLTYANGGNAIATQTMLVAQLPTNTTFVSATAGGVYSAGMVTWGLGQVNTGATGTVQMVARVANPLANGTMITLNNYIIDSNQTSAVSGPAIGTTVTSNPILSLLIADAPDPVMTGADLTYTLRFGNNGNAPATGVAITAIVPAKTLFVSATGGATPSGGQVTWNVGTLNAGIVGTVQMIVHIPVSVAAGTVIDATGWSIDSVETAMAIAPDDFTSVGAPDAPTITSAVEETTNSIYFVRGASQGTSVTGASFLSGIVLNISPDISVGTIAMTGSSQLTAPLIIGSSAALGPRTLTVTNTDGRAGSLADAIAIVKTPDGDGDCRIDGVDLNRMARAWNSAAGEPEYDASVDLDGDSYVGPEDLTIFIKYFAHTPPGCP
jgi:uncharacterized repeat protein (TIGR01451 family)